MPFPLEPEEQRLFDMAGHIGQCDSLLPVICTSCEQWWYVPVHNIDGVDGALPKLCCFCGKKLNFVLGDMPDVEQHGQLPG
jgi:hypothetical protein